MNRQLIAITICSLLSFDAIAQVRNPFRPIQPQSQTAEIQTVGVQEHIVEAEPETSGGEVVVLQEEALIKSDEERIKDGELIYMGKTNTKSIFLNSILNTYEYLDVAAAPGPDELNDD